MEIAALTAFLAPFLPYLVRAGQTAAEEAGKTFGAEAWRHAQRLWDRLRPKVDEEPAAEAAVAEVASRPDDERAQAFLELQLEKLLAADGALAADVARLWAEAQAANVVVATGERSVAVGRDVSGTIVTGDDVRVE
jgi:hypothetical protein